MTPKKFFLFIFIAIIILGFGINVRTIKAQTIDELSSQASALQNKIAACQKQIIDLQTQISALKAQIIQFQTELAQILGKQITSVLSQISQLQKQLPTSVTPTPPVVSESTYKCPDLNNDGTVDVLDAIIISNTINKCSGTSGYDARADVDGNNCVNSVDQNFISKYVNQRATAIAQCKTAVPVVSESTYKCPDLNNDGTVDVLDAIIISNTINKCSGTRGYDSRGDVDGDNCVTSIDQNFISKYANQTASNIAQCKAVTPTPPVVSESTYKCPDLNNDGTVDILDAIIISNTIGKCSSTTGYDSRGDVNGDNCVTSVDQNFISKYANQTASNIAQCK